MRASLRLGIALLTGICAACSSGSSTSDAGSAIDAGSRGGGSDAGSANTYSCTVVQIRNGGCAQAQPPGTLDVAGVSSFSMTIDGAQVSVPGSFSCTGWWDGGTFGCVIGGCPYGASCPADAPTCPGVTWVVSPNDPAGRPLDAGELYAGIPANNSFSAHCAP